MSTPRQSLVLHLLTTCPYRRERDWVLGEFKAGRSPILIATDVASRGLGMFSFLMTSATMVRVAALADCCSVLGAIPR